ncbi:uncharacterized protein LOC122402966 [Colletes gigas]|uniref:uncharacterized protein LOC122402966 n=1 Tax=Colletes gigas TaxID=935657 RepID=UPI001C9A3611|nr:uncharacterized protein LOC122402966 [Colletes gigas]XP_043262142.1 uncharacterized protein LOC122402966 [Colletes gigas]XP_043262143.1 uncharacterized protein LOC122402966 [Colletes gigas]
MSAKKNAPMDDEKRKQPNEKTESSRNSDYTFEPPDGGWGWIIVMAAGFSNFCVLPILQCFGLIFRDRFAELDINSSETTTILNINCAVTACMGLANGPLFRKFSCRQVSFAGALICFVSITTLSTMKTFVGVLMVFSISYAIGTGITMSSNALALNTYFKQKRRIATGLSWTCTGMGPIIIPQVVTLLMPKYGIEGTILIFGGVAFNAVACALLLQPVSQHAKRKRSAEILNANKDEELSTCNKITPEANNENEKSKSLENVANNTKNSTLNLAKGKFGSQYLYYDDEEDGASGIDVIGPGSAMIARANDGWFSRKNTSTLSITSRASRKDSISRNSSRKPSLSLSRQSSINTASSVRNLNRQNSETESYRRRISGLPALPLIIVNESCEHTEDAEYCKDPLCIQKLQQKLATSEEVETDKLLKVECTEETKKTTWLESLIIFFDLDLLRDPVYTNLMLGIVFANFAEMNFALLTPFILGEYGFSKTQVATVMSILAGTDVGTRLTIPFIADCIGWQNRTFFLVGVTGMACGRIVLAHTRDFGIIIAVAVLIGFGKALRTIFMALVIPGHVPLSRLPGATGIQLLTSGIISFSLGPLVGWIRDITSNYAILLHSLNVFTFLTVISWSLEMYFTKRKSKKNETQNRPLAA